MKRAFETFCMCITALLCIPLLVIAFVIVMVYALLCDPSEQP